MSVERNLSFTFARTRHIYIRMPSPIEAQRRIGIDKDKIGAVRAVVWWGERLAGQFEVVVENF